MHNDLQLRRKPVVGVVKTNVWFGTMYLTVRPRSFCGMSLSRESESVGTSYLPGSNGPSCGDREEKGVIRIMYILLCERRHGFAFTY
jgi:hypothetical protein